MFEGVVDAVVKLRSMAPNVKSILRNELATIGVYIDKAFQDKYLELDGRLTSIYKLQKLGKNFWGLDTDKDWDWSGVQPWKLAEAELGTSENSNEEEGYKKKIVEGKKLAAAS